MKFELSNIFHATFAIVCPTKNNSMGVCIGWIYMWVCGDVRVEIYMHIRILLCKNMTWARNTKGNKYLQSPNITVK